MGHDDDIPRKRRGEPVLGAEDGTQWKTCDSVEPKLFLEVTVAAHRLQYKPVAVTVYIPPKC